MGRDRLRGRVQKVVKTTDVGVTNVDLRHGAATGLSRS